MVKKSPLLPSVLIKNGILQVFLGVIWCTLNDIVNFKTPFFNPPVLLAVLYSADSAKACPSQLDVYDFSTFARFSVHYYATRLYKCTE